jgi:hypothetical protein
MRVLQLVVLAVGLLARPTITQAQDNSSWQKFCKVLPDGNGENYCLGLFNGSSVTTQYCNALQWKRRDLSTCECAVCLQRHLWTGSRVDRARMRRMRVKPAR